MTLNQLIEKTVPEIEKDIKFFGDWPAENGRVYTFKTPFGKFSMSVDVRKQPDGKILKVWKSPTGLEGITINDVTLKVEKIVGIFTRNYKLYLEGYKIEDFEEVFVPENGLLLEASIPEPEDHIVLSNGNVLMNKFGKYEPNLCFINTIPHLVWERNIPASKFNLDRGSFDTLRGTFFISKKGTKCFRIEANGPHILIKEDWGGAFCRDRGRNLPEEQALYYRRATSNGGGMGCDYGVYPSDWKYVLSEEDI